MADEEIIVEDSAAETKAEANTKPKIEGEAKAPAPKKKNKKKWVVVGVVLGVILLSGFGFWVWHNDPSFCGTVCHDSMDPYAQTYYATNGQPAVDKWGNDVSNSHAMLATSHAAQGKVCLDCHYPSLSQQLSEASETIAGNYYLPLEEVDTLNLLLNANLSSDSGRGDEFCMNDTCHSDLTRQELTQRTSVLSFNPHAWQHEQNQCSDCHKSHRASTIICTQCHNSAKEILPDGWVEFSTADSYRAAIYG